MHGPGVLPLGRGQRLALDRLSHIWFQRQRWLDRQVSNRAFVPGWRLGEQSLPGLWVHRAEAQNRYFLHQRCASLVQSGDISLKWRRVVLGVHSSIFCRRSRISNQIGWGFGRRRRPIDTTTSGGKLIYSIFWALAEFERNLIHECTQHGLSAARVQGRLGGRPPSISDARIKQARRVRFGGMSLADIRDELGFKVYAHWQLALIFTIDPTRKSTAQLIGVRCRECRGGSDSMSARVRCARAGDLSTSPVDVSHPRPHYFIYRRGLMDDDHIVKHDFNEHFQPFVARLRRAVEHRDSLNKYCDHESAVVVDSTADGRFVEFTVRQAKPIPAVASTILSDWLHQVRSALDGAFYTLAALETGSYPPPQPRNRTFPIRATRNEFDQMIASSSNPTRGMRTSTIEGIERSQPYHGKYGADGDGLLWIHNMARIDRHRHSFNLAMRIFPNDETSVNVDARSCRPISMKPGDLTSILHVEDGLVFATVEFASEEDAKRAVRESSLRPCFRFGLEASEWYKEAIANNSSRNIRNDELTTRMRFCEAFVSALIKMLSDQIDIEDLYIPEWINVGT